MSNETVIPTPAPSDLPGFKILINGNEISSTYQVVSIDVSKIYNRIASAKVILLDGDTAERDFKISNSDDFKPGNEIEIEAGYHSNNETIFKGIIIKHGIKARKDKPSHLTIEAKDKCVKLAVGRKNKYFYESKDSEIIEEIVNTYGISNEVEATSITHKEMVQYYATDWDFILSRAEMNGMLALTDDNTLIIKKPDTSSSSILSLIYGSSLIEFEAEMDARTLYKAVKSASWSAANQELSESEASSPGIKESGNLDSETLSEVIGLEELKLTHTGNIADDELKTWADAQMIKSKLSKIRGRAKFQGYAQVKPGVMIELKGVGDRFNGNVFITGVRHQINSANWETDVQFGLPEKWFYKTKDVVDSPAAGLVPAVHGLQIGVVVQLESDPEGEDRIQVRVPAIDSQEVGIWSRVATLDAGENRGSFFRPEVGDEVIVGFLNDDPRDAVILGMLNSSAKPAPLQASDDNNIKGFITKSKMEFLFDDEKKSITLTTPAGKTVTLNEDEGTILLQDENSNKIEISSDGIAMESAGDITIKAAGDVKIEGANVTNKANAQFKAEGSSGAELSTSGQAVVKGSLVQIN